MLPSTSQKPTLSLMTVVQVMSSIWETFFRFKHKLKFYRIMKMPNHEVLGHRKGFEVNPAPELVPGEMKGTMERYHIFSVRTSVIGWTNQVLRTSQDPCLAAKKNIFMVVCLIAHLFSVNSLWEQARTSHCSAGQVKNILLPNRLNSR